MSGKALTRYRLAPAGLDVPVKDVTGEWVKAEDSDREIKQLEEALRQTARVLELGQQVAKEGLALLRADRDRRQAKLAQVEQERDHLREQYTKVLVAIDEGLVEDDADLAAASVTEMHATINHLLHQVEYLRQPSNQRDGGAT